MTIVSLTFATFVLVALPLFWLTPGPWRAKLVWPILNLAFLCMAMPTKQQLAIVVGFLGGNFLLARFVYGRPRAALVGAVVVIVAVFAWLKNYSFLRNTSFYGDFPFILGLSYMLLRCLQLVVDSGQRALGTSPPGLVQFFSYICAWPMVVSGPVQRFQDYRAQEEALAERRLTNDDVLAASRRLVKGLLYVLLLGDFLQRVHVEAAQTAATLQGLGSSGYRGALLAVAAAAYTGFLYFNFAGYTHIVISVGRLFGFTLPENFNHPWRSQNFLDLWTRWHMSVANWFKTYVFNSIAGLMARHWADPRFQTYQGPVAYFVTFLLLGIWHGPTAGFILCGAMLGLGTSVNKLYQDGMRRSLGKASYRRLCDNFAYRCTAAAMSTAFLSISVIPFWAGREYLANFRSVSGVADLAVMVVALVMLLLPVAAMNFITAKFESSNRRDTFAHLPNVVLGLVVGLIFVYSLTLPGPPVKFVYQEF